MSMPQPNPLPGPMPPTGRHDARDLLRADGYNAVTTTVLDNNPGMNVDLAERIVRDALAFVATAARYPQASIAPSRVVDEGWHALILHTAMYADLCDRLGGFIHHYPERPDTSRFDQQIIDRTIGFIAEAGYTVDADLWRGPDDELVSVAANCQHAPNCSPIVIIPKPKPGVTAV